MHNSQVDGSGLMIETNLAARKARHRRVFAGAQNWSKSFSSMFGAFGATRDAELVRPARRVSKLSPSARLFRSYGLAVTVIFIIGAINPASAYSNNGFDTASLEGVQDFYGSDSLISDEDGYIAKINPQTELADRTTMNGKLAHEIQSGDTLSTIAEEYGLKTNTVMWENGLSSTSTLKVGSTLIIPPVDGVTHVVNKGQDISKIASLYSVPADTVIKQNQLDASATLVPGQSIFIPGAKPLPTAAPIRNTLDRGVSGTRLIAANSLRKNNIGSTALVSGAEIGDDSSAGPATGKTMIFPTRGSITQYYHAGHYADDIADRSKPPIWAAADGVVVKASSGTWGGGYGNHIIIDHGNGLQTLYGHMEYLSVSVGDHVTQGQVIGKMGRTGNVRGVTGIHLHFEVRLNGVKKNPMSYF